MIDRYEDAVIKDVWSQKAQYDRWFILERLWLKHVFKIDSDFGKSEAVMVKALFYEQELNHDVAAFVKAFEEEVKTPYVHFGLTSSDIVDTATMLGMRHSVARLLYLLSGINFRNFLQGLPRGVMIPARTHGVVAEPIPIEALITRWTNELGAVTTPLVMAKFYGKMSGSVGLHQAYPPMKEELVMGEYKVLKELELAVHGGSSQVIPREAFLDVLYAVLKVSSVLSRISVQIRLFASHGEIKMAGKAGSRGSSSMPHKTNPIGFEKICGLHRLIRGCFNAATDNCQLWAERDISNSGVERVIMPDIFHAVCNQASTMIDQVHKWEFDKDALADSLNQDFLSQQRMLHAIVTDSSITREEAYKRSVLP